ncbi:MAG: pyrimidine 5'-nucleotidase [Pseudomonadota bacterium]
MSLKPPAAPAPASELLDRDVWIFDLDNTLYSADCDLFSQVRVKMGEFISRTFSITLDEARALQRKYFLEYGTTLRGLMTVDGIDPTDYLTYVHDIDLNVIGPDAGLAAALKQLPGRKLIFTNASTDHAERVLDRLGIADQFEAIFDVAAASYIPKPHQGPYDTLIQTFGVTPSRAAMVEDMPQNLEPAHAMGMTTVLVETSHDWGVDGRTAPHVHHVVEDLPRWLAELARKTSQPTTGD